MSQAIRTANFIGSLGVNTHLYVTSSNYWDGATVLADLQYLGISNVRDAALSSSQSGQGSYALLADAGIKFDMMFGNATSISDSISKIDAFVTAHPGSVTSIEGPNEIDYTPISYDGLTGVAAAVQYQSDLFTTVNGDTLLNGVVVYNFTDTSAGVAGASNYANTHSYPARGAEPLSQLLADLTTAETANPGKSVVLTEAGYSSLVTSNGLGGVDLATQAKLTLNLIMDATRLGYSTIYLYELLDDADSTNSNVGAHFGLFDSNGNAKPVATAIHNLTTILADSSSNASTFTTGTLNYTVSNLPSTAYNLLMEKSSGAYDIVLWNEPKIWDGTTNTEIAAAATTVTINLGATYATVDVYDTLTGTTAILEEHNVSSIQVSLTDHPIVIEVSNATTTNATAAATTTSTSTTTTATTTTTVTNTDATVSGTHTLYGGDGNDQLNDSVANGVAITMEGGKGNDTYVVSNSNDIIIENPGEGSDAILSSVNFTMPANVETMTMTGSANLVGRASDGDVTLIANSGNDTLYGGAGTDNLFGGAGNSTLIAGSGNTTMTAGSGVTTMIGGSGNDYYVVNNSADVVQAQAGGGTDTIQSSVSFTAPANVTGLTLTGSADLTARANDGTITLQANSGNDTLYGGAGTDTLLGGAGNSTLIAGSGNTTMTAGSGVTTMIGGSGNNTYIVNNSADVVQAQAGGGADAIRSSVSFTAPANVTSMTFTGTNAIIGRANDGNMTLTANNGTDILYGGAGVDRLVGAAGAVTMIAGTGDTTFVAGSAKATMIGGSGNETYIVNRVVDVVQAQAGGGTDIILSSVSFTAPANVTGLTLTGNAALTAHANDGTITLKANNGNDTLYGGAGTDTLLGGSGTDTLIAGSGNTTMSAGTGVTTMIGGSGNNYYIVNNTADVVQAQAGGGGDTILSSVSFTAPVNVTGLTLTGSADLVAYANDGTITLKANSGNDTLYGGAGTDTLLGGSGVDTLIAGSGNTTMSAGTGVTTMIGGSGNNYYIVNNTADVVQAQAGGGSDTILSSVSFTAPANVTGLTLTGSADLTAYANDGTITLKANSGNDTLYGGAGSSILIGGSGTDTLVAGSGYTVLSAGSGVTTMIGGTGTDFFQVNNTADVIIANAAGSNTVQSSVSYTAPANVATLTMTGTAALTATANGMNMTLNANSGGDTLIGGSGQDHLNGGAGNDTLISGSGFVMMTGGGGSDDFVFKSVANAGTYSHPDYITDFVSGKDTIDLSALAHSALNGGALTFIGTQAFTHVSGQLHYSVSSNGLLLSGDVNGDGVADFGILLQHVSSISSHDLLLG